MADATKLTGGTCVVGAHRVDITPHGKHAMAGYSWAGQVGRPAAASRPEHDRLWARALYLEDSETGEAALFCFVDLMSASLRLLQEVRKRLDETDPDLGRSLILSGTHTHTAPGQFYGNRFYDLLAQKSLSGFDASWTSFAAERIAEACIEARRRARPGSLTVHQTMLWGQSRNRSHEAYLENPSDPEEPRAPFDLPSDYQAIDPRLTVLEARAAGKLVGIFSWFGCHATALGPMWKTFHRDWPGMAVASVEHTVGDEDCVVAMGAGAGGDVTPMDPKNADRAQGLALARRVGEAVGKAVVAVVGLVRDDEETGPLPLTLRSGLYEVRPTAGTPRWAIGVPALGGAEDGGPFFRSWKWISGFFSEGFQGGYGDQAPKAPALGSVQAALRGWVDLAPCHPWHRLRLGDHVICTVPGEPTVCAARQIRRAARERLGVTSVSVLGYTGDYAGYFTTTPEYRAQHYEGASTLYGPYALDRYVEQMLGAERPAPDLGEGPRPIGFSMPQRAVEELLDVAYEQPRYGGMVRLVFATEGRSPSLFPPVSGERALAEPAPARSSPPRVALVQRGQRVPGFVRPELNPDEASALSVHVALFERADLRAAGISLDGAELEVTDGGEPPTRLSIRPLEEVEEERGPVASADTAAHQTTEASGLRQRALSVLALVMVPPLMVTLFGPGWLLDAAAVAATPFRELLVRMLGLSFGLLGINLLFGKNSRDTRALLGILAATAVFWGSLAALGAVLAVPSTAIGVLAVIAVGFGGFALWVREQGQRGPTPTPEAWPFWKPLFWVGMLTLVVGTFLVLGAHLAVSWLGVRDPIAHWFIRAYGVSFLVNTISMWGSQYTRDLAVIKGQILGSLFLDSITSCLLISAVGLGTVNLLGYALAAPYVGITLWFPRLLSRARRLQRLDVAHPHGAREIASHIGEARAARKLLRAIGSGHSIPRAIEADRAPSPPLHRPSRLPGIHLSLERMDRIVDVDRTKRRLTVQAGMHLGEAPNSPGSVQNNLTRHLAELGWALPDLGGIVHQTVGGFLATGSSGGSLVHSLNDAVVEIRFVDGAGRLRVAHRTHSPDLFQATMVSLGLFGVVTEVTFECEPAYQIEGREVTGTVVGAPATVDDPVRRVVLQLPTDDASGSTEIIDLLSPGEDGLAAYLRRIEYCRILWWPQAGVHKMVAWEGKRTFVEPTHPRPYEADGTIMQWLAGRVLTLWGLARGRGIVRAVGRWTLPLFPLVVKFFLPDPPKRFHARWDLNLPMDTHVDDFFLPTEFTELWFPIEHTAEVMKRLLELYRDPDVAGTYACELYATKASTPWLSPAYERDVFRVDVFWFRGNEGDPVIDYFPKFWDALGDLEFRAHWGKYLPRAGSTVGRAMATRYPRWNDFLRVRQECDPDEVFLSRYWRRHLGLHTALPDDVQRESVSSDPATRVDVA